MRPHQTCPLPLSWALAAQPPPLLARFLAVGRSEGWGVHGGAGWGLPAVEGAVLACTQLHIAAFVHMCIGEHMSIEQHLH